MTAAWCQNCRAHREHDDTGGCTGCRGETFAWPDIPARNADRALLATMAASLYVPTGSPMPTCAAVAVERARAILAEIDK